MTYITATCHCGAVSLTAKLVGRGMSPARCTCSFCKRRQAGNVSVSYASLTVTKGAGVLRKYQFGTQTAEHYFCTLCGIYTHHRRRSDPSECGVNIGCIAGEKPWDHEPMVWHDGIDHPADLA